MFHVIIIFHIINIQERDVKLPVIIYSSSICEREFKFYRGMAQNSYRSNRSIDNSQFCFEKFKK